MRPIRPIEPNLRRAAKALLEGKLVVLPTETVYGLAADAANPEAVHRIFSAKGRPSDNPLIVHVGFMESIANWASEIPDELEPLARAFWPGPLTVVLPKHRRVPFETTGGLDSVAIRIPSHTATLAVIQESELGLAMPSANPFMNLSPTRADAIDPSLFPFIECIIDGGPSRVGIESTVLSLVGKPQILRPGMISAEEIEAVLGQSIQSSDQKERLSPGMYQRHYAPKTPAILVDELDATDSGLTFSYAQNPNQIQMPSDAINYAKKLYSALADMEQRDLEIIKIQRPTYTDGWEAIMDRLEKATAPG